MKKKIIASLILVLMSAFIAYSFTSILQNVGNSFYPQYNMYVSSNGWLKVEGTNIKNNRNETFNLRGLSSHGLQWHSDILTYDNLKNLKESWNINTFRLAMYTWQKGYISNKEEMKNKVINISNILIDLDMYVIIDWHTLLDNNPNTYIEESKEFFNEISAFYKDTPNIIYEICNEPNGNSVSWDNDIKPYAEQIIPIIRNNSPNSLIIVGTPTWCRELTPVAENPLNFENILYSCHFYAATHKQELRDEIDRALEKNLPIIVSEWGTTDYSGDGTVDVEESKTWINFLKERNISFINWSFSYNNQTSSIINPQYLEAIKELENSDDPNKQNIIIDFNNYLTDSGKLVKSLL